MGFAALTPSYGLRGDDQNHWLNAEGVCSRIEQSEIREHFPAFRFAQSGLQPQLPLKSAFDIARNICLYSITLLMRGVNR